MYRSAGLRQWYELDVLRLTCLHFALRDELVCELQRRVAPLHLRLTRQEAGQRLGLLVHLPQQTLYALRTGIMHRAPAGRRMERSIRRTKAIPRAAPNDTASQTHGLMAGTADSQ